MYIFLDLDGPILDVSEKYYCVYSDLVDELGGKPITKEEFWEYKRQRAEKGKILARSLIPGEEERYSERRREIIETEGYLRIDSIWPGVKETLHEISKSCSLYLVTARSNRSSLLWQLKTLGINSLFKKIISPDENEMFLPREELKSTMVRRELGKIELNGWFIGDTDTDTVAGKLLELRTGVVTYGIRSEEIVNSYGADEVFSDPSEFISWSALQFS